MRANTLHAVAAAQKLGFLISGIFITCLFACLLAAPSTAHATEGGGTHYPNGAEDFMSGAVPPPGTYIINYMNYYSADKFKLKSSGEIPNFKLSAFADVLRVIHVTKYQLFGANWGFHAFIPVANVDVTLPYGRKSQFGVGDIIVDPVIFSWHSKNLHVATGVDVFVPSGQYDKNKLVSIGRNYWTFEPILAATFVSDEGLELSAKLMYDFNTKNTATEYTSGQEFHFDYTLGYKISPFTVGVGGYFYKQITNDKQYGSKVGEDGFRGQVLGVGPQVKYDYKNMSFILKYQREFIAENRPEGNNFWFKFVYAF
jgi:hypothetical protein